MAAVPTIDVLRALGAAHGLHAVGVAPADVFEGTRRDLHERKVAGLHGGMAFTYRNPDRSTDPCRTLPGARALVVAARAYMSPDQPAPTRPAGRIARYARRDHYAELRAGLDALAAHLHECGWQARAVADDNALVDREAARRAGLGWYGRNANLLLPGQGSWFVLGSVITTAPLTPTSTDVRDQCGTCTRCIDGCPTGAIVAPGVVDARRCLAWLLQMEGTFPREHRIALGDRIYGCDDCQDVCPINRRATVQPASQRDRAWAELLELLDPDDEVVLATAGCWYIPRRDVRYVRRNALVVLGNVGDPADPAVVAALEGYVAHPDPLLRAHACWAARRLGLDQLVGTLHDDPDPLVRDELVAPVEPRFATTGRP